LEDMDPYETAAQRTLPPFRSVSLGHIYPDPQTTTRFPVENASFSPNAIPYVDERPIKSEFDQHHYTLPTIFPSASVHPYLPSPSNMSPTIPGTTNHGFPLRRIEEYEHHHRSDVY
jgi:hypothetical protein